jgi:hypothetical protein
MPASSGYQDRGWIFDRTFDLSPENGSFGMMDCFAGGFERSGKGCSLVFVGINEMNGAERCDAFKVLIRLAKAVSFGGARKVRPVK